MLYDKEFLLKLDKVKNKTLYARIITLNFEEYPVETIEGRITQGSINIDGSSAVRRSCSLTMIAQDFNYNDFYWGLNTKFKLEVGVQNTIDKKMPDVIWFNQGIYIITTFSTSHSTNNFTITLQGKDKMCLLNGEIGGSVTSTVDFGKIEEESFDGVWNIRSIPIKKIIRNMLHEYAKEPLHNIIIKDIDDLGLELLEYRYNIPMYLYRDINSPYFNNVLLDGKKKCYADGVLTILNDLQPTQLDMLVNPLTGSTNPAKIRFEDTPEDQYFYVSKINFGDTAGYRTTELVYAGDLIANTGEPITSVLDKIKNMLGEFEYFYNTDGQFVFQRKQSFINVMWNSNDYKVVSEEGTPASIGTAYIFNEGELINSFNNNPNLTNLRNDYAVWGKRISVSGAEIPVHIRYAIDKKPSKYKQIEITEQDKEIIQNYNNKYGTSVAVDVREGKTYTIEDWDWREIIYQMALDYYQYGSILDDFELRVAKANPEYNSGTTGYESYYIDLQGFWRQLYDPNGIEENFYPSSNKDRRYWSKNVFESPETLNFWFDFLDSETDISKFGVRNVGLRTKAVNDNNVKSIYFRETPQIVFTDGSDNPALMTGYKFIQIPKEMIDTMFSISSQGKSAKTRIDELLYSNGYCIETITINTIPVYYLESNIRINIHDEKSKLNGDYIIDKISIPLSYNGKMSITATKAVENII